MEPFCEACLSREKLFPLTEAVIVDGHRCRYAELFSTCLNIEIVEIDSDPSACYLCESCGRRLVDAAEFRCQVTRVRKRLAESSLIKTEVLDYAADSPLDEAETTADAEYVEVEISEVKPSITEERSDSKRKLKFRKRHKEPSPAREYKTKRSYRKQTVKDKSQKTNLPIDAVTLTCKLCERKFENILVLQRHMAHHFPEHLCEICGNVYRKMDHLRIHLKTHSMTECSICKKTMKEGSLKKHSEKYHKSKKQYYLCSTCFEKFKTIGEKRSHMREKHGQDLGGRCDICNKIFAARSNLKVHIRAVHQKEVNVYCHHCGKGFLNSYTLTRHMLKHTGIRNYVCEICHKAYLNKDTLTAHMRIHKSEKDFVCSMCAKAFTYKCSLKGHMKTHHPHVPFEG